MISTAGPLSPYTVSELLHQNFIAILSRTAMIQGAMEAYRTAIVNLGILDPDRLTPALRDELSARRSIGFNRIKVWNHYDRFELLVKYTLDNMHKVPKEERDAFFQEVKTEVLAFLEWLAEPERVSEFPSLEEIKRLTEVNPEGGESLLDRMVGFFGLEEHPLQLLLQTASAVSLRLQQDPVLTHTTYQEIVQKITQPSLVPTRARVTLEELAEQRRAADAARSPKGLAFVEKIREQAQKSAAAAAAAAATPAAGQRAAGQSPVVSYGFTRLPTATPARMPSKGLSPNKSLNSKRGGK